MLLCPSMMCADPGNLEEQMQELEAAGADIFHVDIMDGKFVPNFAMGMQDVEYICKHSKIPVDAHLMIMEPGNYVSRLVELGVKIIYIHPEADMNSVKTLQSILELGAIPGIAISPGTSVETVLPLLTFVKYVLVMSVNPGFAGQRYIPMVDEKIQKLIGLKAKYGYKVIVDGACSPEKIYELRDVGVEGFVLGTSALFGKKKDYKVLMNGLRQS